MKRILTAFGFMLLATFVMGAGEVSGPETSYGGTPGIKVYRANGHSQDRIAVRSGDIINGLYGYGYNGSAFTTNAGVAIKEKASQNWTTTANGTKITFETTPDGSTTATEVMSIDNAGNLTVAGALDVTGSITVAAVLNLYTRTSAQIKITTPTAVGQVIFDTTLKQIVIGTATANCTSWVNSTGTVPSGY